MATPVPRGEAGASPPGGSRQPLDREAANRVLAEVSGLLADLHAGVVRPVRLDSDLAADLGLDSLAIVELHDRLQAAFGVTLPEEVMSTAATPGDWLRAVLDARAQLARPAVPSEPRPQAPPARAAGEPWPVDAPTLLDALAWHVDAHPDLASIRILGSSPEISEVLTYDDLDAGARAVAAGLAADGLARGERVAMMLPTGRAYFLVFLGVLLAGGVPVPIYPPARMAVLEEHLGRQARLLDNAGAALLVTVPEAMVAARLLRPHVPTLRGVRTLETLVAAGRGRAPLPAVRPKDLALIQYTSGSTGDPKGVVLTQAQVLANIAAMGQAARVTTADVFVSWLPLYHDMGLIGAWLAPLFFGMSLVIMSPLTFLARPLSWLEAITTYSGTLSAAPNFAYQSCVDRIREADLAGLDLSSWRLAFNGSESVSAATVEQFIERFSPCGFKRQTMCPAYGLAEVGVGIAFSPLDRGPCIDTVARGPLQRSGRANPAPPGPGATALVGCGLPLPGYEIRVVGPRGEELPDRREGAVCCRGPSATTGYFANEAANRALWRKGWLVTGDLGYMADGEVFLTGRTKDLVIRGGRKLHPEELEDAVGALGGVRPRGVAVFASADPSLGTERLVVVAETDLVSPEDRADLEARITRTSVDLVGSPPDEVVLTTAGALVRTSSGKLRRGATREAFETGVLGRRPAPAVLQLARFGFSGLGAAIRGVLASAGARCVGAYLWVLVGLVALPIWLVSFLPWSVRARWELARAGGRAYCAMAGINFSVEGSLPASGRPAVVVANHPSFVDGLALLLASPGPLVFVTSTDIGRQPVAGGYLRRLGCVFVERGQAEGSTQAVRRLAVQAAAGERLAVFPEGSISPVPGLRTFHLGAFATACEVGCPVVPVGICGTRAVVRPGTYLPHRANVSVRIGEPVSPTGTGFAAEVALRDLVRAKVAELSGEPEAA